MKRATLTAMCFLMVAYLQLHITPHAENDKHARSMPTEEEPHKPKGLHSDFCKIVCRKEEHELVFIIDGIGE